MDTVAAFMRKPNPNLTAAFALIAVLALAGGCGGSDEDEPADTVRAYLEAFGSGDGEAACEKLTESTRRLIVPQAARGVGARDCAGAIRALHDRLTIAQAREFEDAEPTDTKIRGENAEVKFRAGSLRGKAELREVDGEWKVSLVPRAR